MVEPVIAAAVAWIVLHERLSTGATRSAARSCSSVSAWPKRRERQVRAKSARSRPPERAVRGAHAPDTTGQDGHMHPNVRMVQDALVAADAVDGAGEPSIVQILPDAVTTAAAAADALGVEVGQIANSLVFAADDDAVLVMTSGAHRVDTAKVAALARRTRPEARHPRVRPRAHRSGDRRRRARSATRSRCAPSSTRRSAPSTRSGRPAASRTPSSRRRTPNWSGSPAAHRPRWHETRRVAAGRPRPAARRRHRGLRPGDGLRRRPARVAPRLHRDARAPAGFPGGRDARRRRPAARIRLRLHVPIRTVVARPGAVPALAPGRPRRPG